jgi:hypothetical protein
MLVTHIVGGVADGEAVVFDFRLFEGGAWAGEPW